MTDTITSFAVQQVAMAHLTVAKDLLEKVDKALADSGLAPLITCWERARESTVTALDSVHAALVYLDNYDEADALDQLDGHNGEELPAA
jgi:hypothetical protein